MYIMLYNTVEENDEMSSTDTEIYLTGFLYFLWLAQIGLKCSWNTELKIKLQKYWFVFITYMMLDMLVAILCNFNIESDNKCLFFFMHFCYFFLSICCFWWLITIFVCYWLSLTPFPVPDLLLYTFILFAWFVLSDYPHLSLHLFSMFAFPLWVLLSCAISFLHGCVSDFWVFFCFTFFFFFTSFGILVRMMTFHWCRSQCWVEKRWKRERERSDRANLPTAINLNITINSCVSF